VSTTLPAETRRERRQFVTHNVVAGAGTWLAGVLGLLLQAFVSHHFGPADYGQAFAVFTFFTVITQPAAGFSRMIAWSTSRELAGKGGDTGSIALLRSTNIRLLVVGSTLALALVAASPLLSAFLHVPAEFVILGALGVPFMLSTSPLQAFLQGEQRWLPWSGLSVAIALGRVIFVALMVIPFGIAGVVLGISIAAAAVYFIALGMVWSRLTAGSGRADWRSQRNFLIVSVGSTITMSILMGSDILLVEHFFSAREGGQFSSVTVTSRALFFAMGSVTSVLFPKVAARQARSQSTRSVVFASLALGMGGGLLGLLVFSVGSDTILRSFSGRAYLAGSSYIGLYALGMPLLASVVMLSNSLQALADLRLLWLLVPGALLKPLLIIFFHSSLLVVAVVSDVSIGLLFIALAVTYVVQERRRLARATALAGSGALVLSARAAVPVVSEAATEATPVPLSVPVFVSVVEPMPVTEPGAPPRWVLDLVNPRLWLARTSWLVERPKRVIAGLALLGIAIRHAWISTTPLSAGDWHWPDRQRLLEYFPWPSVWDSTLGLGGENRFVSSFRFPVAFVSGLLSTLGATWTFIEKFLYFVPFAILLPVAGWLLAREIMGRTRWAILTPIILLGSTYFTLESDGEIPLALAEVVSMLALIAFLRAMKRRSVGWGAATGLLTAATAAFDIRPAYLCVVLMAIYFVILAVVEPGWSVLSRRLLAGAVAGVVFAGSQAYWLVPLLTYHGNAGFPTPQAPNFNILTMGHGLTGVSAFWTGGQTAQLVQAPLNPAYMILPLLALTPLLARRLRPEVLWLATAALLFAFFAKTDTAPLGGLYDWMYLHVPGWKLFREGSKFLYVVALAYAILIPIALASAFDWARSRPDRFSRLGMRGSALAALGAVVALSCSTVAVMQSGSLGSTTVPTPEPASFSALSSMLAADSRPGSVLWFGQPVTSDGIRNHHFLIASPDHPAVDLTGSFSSTKINQRDPFQLYCANNLIPFCYADKSLFPYLTQVTGAGYVVVPGGQAAGSIKKGVTRTWLAGQMTSMFGDPTVLGSGDTALLVWRMPAPEPAVTSSPAVALVDSGTWATPAALPALQALGLPAAYLQSFDTIHYPVAPAQLPDAVRVLPRSDGGCLGSVGGTVGVMAQTTAASVDVTIAGSAQTLPLLTTSARLSSWGVYGPVEMAGGTLPITAAGIALGPCIQWSSLASAALAGHTDPVGGVSVGANGEQIQASSAGAVGSWVELRRYFDPGWRLDGRKPAVLGDGLFNLYHLTAAQANAAKLDFSFSTIPFEHIGQGIAVVVVGMAVFLIIWDRRRRRGTEVVVVPAPMLVPSSLARWIAAVGIGLLAITALVMTLEWFGVPSALPAASIAADPYAVDIGYGAGAVAVLLLSLLLRVAIHIARSGRVPESQRAAPVSARMGFAATLIIGLCVVLTACGDTTVDDSGLISEAQQAGAVAPTIQGSSLDDARLQRSARQPALCIADYTQALKDFPDLGTAYAGRGDCYLNGGQNGPAAVHDYSQAISLTPLSADLYLRRAVADRVSGNVSAAILDYEQAAAIPSAGAAQLLTAVGGLTTLADVTDAENIYSAALAREPSSALLHLAGATIAIASGNDQLADQEFARAQQLAVNKSQTATVLTYLCHVAVMRHQYDKAASECTVAAQLSAGGSGAESDLSAAQLALGNPSAALVAMNASIGDFISNIGPYAQESGVDGFGLSNLYTARGWIEVQLHDRAAGIVDFQRALDSLPPGTGPDARARVKAYIATAKAD
jgi:O-antigen/teichoic acid export membrane protein/tetratricopeptide (TPR) repeat protein